MQGFSLCFNLTIISCKIKLLKIGGSILRQLYSALIIVVFIAVQLAVLPVSFILAFTNPGITETEMLDAVMPYQAIAFAIGVVIVIALGHIHKNKNRRSEENTTELQS